MKVLLMFLLALFSINLYANREVESLLLKLDMVLSKRVYYMNQKEKSIKALKDKLSNSKSLSEQYFINKAVIKEYNNYQCDSAILYINRNIDLAQRLNKLEYKIESELELSKLLAMSGLFTESFKTLSSFNSDKLSKELLKKYYSCYILLYYALSKYTDNKVYTTSYKKDMNNYINLLSNLSSAKGNLEFIYKLYSTSNNEKVVQMLLDQIPYIDPSSHMYAIVTSRLAYSYMEMGKEPELQKKYLILAAITDAKLAIMENSALLNLAILINKEGDVNRAYKYVKIAMQDANFNNSRHRNVIIAKVQPIIEKAYLSKIEQQQQNLKIYLLLVSILVIGLAITIFYVYKQIKVISKTRRELEILNKNLEEANHIKEEYIGYFLNQCSIYINKLDKFKQIIYRKIKAGQIDSLMTMVSVSSSTEKDVEEFYRDFDIAFLRLYPNFVKNFNLLLKENERYKLKANQLNTELRIFALIQLGITDSKQISIFLRYSIQTIYNYRSKIKGKVLYDCDNFEEKIKKQVLYSNSNLLFILI